MDTRIARAAIRLDLAGLELAELEPASRSRSARRAFHAGQIFAWIHRRGVTDFAAMTDLPKELRAAAGRRGRSSRPSSSARTSRRTARRSTCFELADGARIESVYIPDTPAQTFCISSQVGCAMACAFCLTGKMGLIRHLTAGEIVGQVRVLAHDLGLAALDRAFNIVRHGHGRAAAQLRRDDGGAADGRRRARLRRAAAARSRCRRWAWCRPSRSWAASRSCRTSRSRCTRRPRSSATRWCRSTASTTSRR